MFRTRVVARYLRGCSVISLACMLMLAALPSPATAQTDSSAYDAYQRFALAEPSLAEMDIEMLAAAIGDAIAADIRRTWDVQCDAAAWNILDNETADSIKLTVTNSGDCEFTVKLHKAGGAATEPFIVPAGTPTTINRSNVLKIEIDCKDSVLRCKASYTLVENATAVAVNGVIR